MRRLQLSPFLSYRVSYRPPSHVLPVVQFRLVRGMLRFTMGDGTKGQHIERLSLR